MKTVTKFLVTTFFAILTGDIILSTVPLFFTKEQGVGRGWELQLVKKSCGEGEGGSQSIPFSLAVRILLGVACFCTVSLLFWRKIKEKEGVTWSKVTVGQNVPWEGADNEGVQQEAGESGDVRPLLDGPPQLRPPHELPDAGERGPRQEEAKQDCVQPLGQETPSLEKQLDLEESASQEKSLTGPEKPAGTPSLILTSNSSLQILQNSLSYNSDSQEDGFPSHCIESKEVEERILSFEQRLEAVEVGLKDTETVTKMWSSRIEQAEGELSTLHKQMFRILSRTSSELNGKFNVANSQLDLQDINSIDTLKNISAIIEESKHQVSQMTPMDLDVSVSQMPLFLEDFNPVELPILVRLPSLESIPVKDSDTNESLNSNCVKPGRGRLVPSCKVPTRYVTTKKAAYFDSNSYVASKGTKGVPPNPKKPQERASESTDLINKYTFLASVKKKVK